MVLAPLPSPRYVCIINSRRSTVDTFTKGRRACGAFPCGACSSRVDGGANPKGHPQITEIDTD